MRIFKIIQAIAIKITGNSKITPLAYNRQPISEGSAIMNRITARIFASPQATLNINRIEPKNIQQNKIKTNNSNIFNLQYENWYHSTSFLILLKHVRGLFAKLLIAICCMISPLLFAMVKLLSSTITECVSLM